MHNTLFKKGLVVGIIILFIGVSVLSSVSSKVISVTDEKLGDGDTEYWALLIAVGVYADKPDKNMPCVFEWCDDMYELLLDSPTWSEDHIKVLQGKDTSVGKIIKGLKWLDKMDDGDDISLIYITTHGAHLSIDHPPHDEEDGTDECIWSHWGFIYPNSPMGYIWDDELNFFLNKLESEGVCVIIESCFSGGFNDPQNLLINRYKTVTSTVEPSFHTESDWMEGFSKELRGKGRVIVMSCREQEVCYLPMFSPLIVDGLRGYADRNEDNIVSAEELYYYSESRCYWQQPTIYDDYEGELALIQVNGIKNGNENYKSKYNIKHDTGPQPEYHESFPKSVTVCGYVNDIITNYPIEDTGVSLHWHSGTGGDDWEWTDTNSDGFYSFNIPAGYVFLGFKADNYLYKESEMYKINEFDIKWINASLEQIPPKNAILCGYIKDLQTNEPIDTYVHYEWRNNSGGLYWTYCHTDTSGFYIQNIPAGEVYCQIWKSGYLDIETYRYDANEDHPLWMNFSLEPETISVDIIKPLNAIYRKNNLVIPFDNPLIIGSIEIEAYIHDYWYNLWENIDKVEFYIDEELKATVTTEPYRWRWNEKTPSLKRYTIKVIAFDGENSASDQIEVRRLL